MAGRSSPKAAPVLMRAQTAVVEGPKVGICCKCASRTKHNCKACGRKACDKHSQKRKVQGLEIVRRICDNCSETQLKREGKSELELEIAQMRLDMQRALEENEQLGKRIEEVKVTKQQFLTQIDRVKEQRTKADAEIQAKLDKETARDNEIRNSIDKLQHSLDETNSAERALNEESTSLDRELESLRKEALSLREEKTSLMHTLQDIDLKEKSSVPLAHLRALACDVCRRRLDMTYRPRRSMQQPGAVTSSVTSLPRPSAALPVVPADKKKDCELM